MWSQCANSKFVAIYFGGGGHKIMGAPTMITILLPGYPLTHINVPVKINKDVI